MIYVVVKQPPFYRQMSLDEFLFGNPEPVTINSNETNTRTYCVEELSNRFKFGTLRYYDIIGIFNKLRTFNAAFDYLREKDRHSLYNEFYIPKRSGGLRKIDAPNQELMGALRMLKGIFEEDCKALYHTSAFAYIKGRSTIDAVKRHQANESRWYAKFDLSNFFGSTTLEYVMHMLSMIYPFSEIVKTEAGKEELSKALELAFLDGGLPQGTPISPLITNIMMIPVDYELYNAFREFEFISRGEEKKKNYCVYTRYADDFIVSSAYDFDFKQAEQRITATLEKFSAPFAINSQKTRYGSSAGSNWNLGVMINKDNKITIGYKRKKQFTAMISSYAQDRKHGVMWDKSDIQVMEGHRNYYKMVEGEEAIDGIIRHLGEKYNMNIFKAIKDDLSA